MLTWMNGKRKHFLFWAVFLLYLGTANPLYIHYFLKDGKPVSTSAALPATSSDIFVKLNDKLTLVQSGGQDFYELIGFAFTPSNPQKNNTIFIVLHSMTRTLVFPTDAPADTGMIKSYTGYKPGMDHAEFMLRLARDVVPPGTYQVGILVQAPGETTRSFTPTGSLVKTTPNTVAYIPGL